MRTRSGIIRVLALAAAVDLSSVAAVGASDEATRELRDRVESMEKELKELRQKLDATEHEVREVERQTDPRERANSKWHWAGYTSATFTHTDEKGKDDFFALGSFNPVLHYQYKDLVFFEAELEMELEDDGGTETNLEYAAANLMLHDSLTLVAGDFLSPIGQFQERLHPAWINKLPEAPVGFGHGGIQPLSDVGVQIRGGVPFGPSLATYAIYAGNGPRLGEHGPELEAFGRDDNSNKAVGGRIGFLPLPWVEVGGSFLVSEIDGAGGSDADFRLFGADLAFTKGGFDVRFEYLNARLDSLLVEGAHAEEEEAEEEEHGEEAEDVEGPAEGPEMAELLAIPRTDWEAWYVQVAYRLSHVTQIPLVKNLEPVVRYGKFDVFGFDEFGEDAEKRLDVGMNYLFTPSLIGKVAVGFRDLEASERDDHTVVQTQLAYGF